MNNYKKIYPSSLTAAVCITLACLLPFPAAYSADTQKGPPAKVALKHESKPAPPPPTQKAMAPAGSTAPPPVRPAPAKDNRPPPKEERPPASGEARRRPEEMRVRPEHHFERDDGAEAGFLRKAYVALSEADHDYDGHRDLAMGQTAEAARMLGEMLAGDGQVRERQVASDVGLREADGFLASASSLAAFHRHSAVLEHIAAARRQIAIALHIR